MSLSRVGVTDLLFKPLPELAPPGLDGEQLAGLRSLPGYCRDLRLIHAIAGLEALAERPAHDAVDAILLTARVLAAIGEFAANNPGLTLASLRQAAAQTLVDLGELPVDQELLSDPPDATRVHTVLVAAAAVYRLKVSVNGQYDELVCISAARMLAHLWDFATERQQRSGKREGSPGP